ncbi:hypothetical protein STEG23_015753 [Scotinomys teguina]
MEMKAAAPRCQLLLILLMSAEMLLPGTNGSLLLVQRTVTRTYVLQETISKAVPAILLLQTSILKLVPFLTPPNAAGTACKGRGQESRLECGILGDGCSGWLFKLSLEVPPPLIFPMTVMPLGQDQDCSLKIREPDVPAPWFLDPGGWSKTAAVSLYFIFPGICTLSLDKTEISTHSFSLLLSFGAKAFQIYAKTPVCASKLDHSVKA